MKNIKEENDLLLKKVSLSDQELWDLKQAFDFFDVDGGNNNKIIKKV